MELKKLRSWRFRQLDARLVSGLIIMFFALCLNLSCQRAIPMRDESDEKFLGFEKAQEVPFDGWVKALVFTKGGQRLVVGGCQFTVSGGRTSCASGLIHEWNLKEAASKVTVEFPRPVTALAVSQDGAQWVAGDAEGRLIRSTAPKTVPKTSFHQKGEITSLAFSADGKWIVSGSNDPSYPLGFLDVATGGMVKVKTKFAPVSALTFSPDGKELAIGMLNGALVLWEFKASSVPFSITFSSTEAYAIESLAFSPDGYRLAYGGRDGKVVIWDRRSSKSLMEFKGASSVTTLTFSPDGRYLAVGQESGKLLLVESKTGLEVWSTRYHLPVQDLAYSPDGTSIAVAVQQRVYLNRVRGAAPSSKSRQEAEHLSSMRALQASKLMPSRISKLSIPAGSSKKLAEVMSICQDEYMWLLPFDSLAASIIEAMVKTVPGVTVKRQGLETGDQLVIREGGRSFALSLTPLRQAKGKVALQRTVQLYESAQQFMLASHPGSEGVLEDAAIVAFLAQLGPGLRVISDQELRWQVLQADLQSSPPMSAAQTVEQDGLLFSALSENVKYLKLDGFTRATAGRVREWLAGGTSAKAAAVVHLLDLRDNRGSDLGSLIETASSLLPKGEFITWAISRKNGEATEYRSKGSPLPGLNLVVLVNEQTAGTAELLACAIREARVGVIVGRRTAGVDEMYTTFPLSDGTGLRVSTERFYCPGKRSIRWVGQSADVEVGHIASTSAVKIGSVKVSSAYHANQLASSLPFISDNQLRVGVEIALCIGQTSDMRLSSVEGGRLAQDLRDLRGKCIRNYN